MDENLMILVAINKACLDAFFKAYPNVKKRMEEHRKRMYDLYLEESDYDGKD